MWYLRFLSESWDLIAHHPRPVKMTLEREVWYCLSILCHYTQFCATILNKHDSNGFIHFCLFCWLQQLHAGTRFPDVAINTTTILVIQTLATIRASAKPHTSNHLLSKLHCQALLVDLLFSFKVMTAMPRIIRTPLVDLPCWRPPNLGVPLTRSPQLLYSNTP